MVKKKRPLHSQKRKSLYLGSERSQGLQSNSPQRTLFPCGERGSIGFFSIALVCCGFSLLLLQILSYLHLNQELEHKYQNYLCAKTYTHFTHEYLVKMQRSNEFISWLFAASFIPPLTPWAERAKQVVSANQIVLTFSYTKNILSNTYCSKAFKALSVIRPLYRMKGLQLTRDSVGRALLRENRWQRTLYPHLSLSFHVKENAQISFQTKEL